MRKSELTHEMIREFLDYDKITGILTWRYRSIDWFSAGRKRSAEHTHNHWNNKHYGKPALNTICIDPRNGRKVKRGRLLGRAYLTHHIIWFWMTGAWPDPEIDHKDRNSINNEWGNLREVPHRMNVKNQTIRKDNTSGVVGVYKTKCGHFMAMIKNKSIGTYKTLSEAARVRKNAERRYGFSEGHGSSKVPQ